MSEQEKKGQSIYDLLNAETKPKFLCQPYTKQRKLFYKKSFIRERCCGGLNKSKKRL